MEMSEVIPQLGTVADELCMVRSMYTEHNNHTEALIMLVTGSDRREAQHCLAKSRGNVREALYAMKMQRVSTGGRRK